MPSITTAEFRSWADSVKQGGPGMKSFFDERVDPNVSWTVSGPGTGDLGKTTPITGEYTSSAAFFKGAVIPLNACFNEPIKFEVVDAFVQPTEFNDDAEKNITKAVLEMTGTATIKKTGKVWVNHYCWVFHFDNTTKKAIRVRAYLDSAAVNIALEA